MRLSRLLGALLLVAIATFALVPGSRAAGGAEDFDSVFAGWRKTADAVQSYIDKNGDDDGTVDYKSAVQALIDQAKTLQTNEQALLDPLKAQLAQLGPEPAPDAPKESDKIATLRASLTAKINLHETHIKQCSLAILKGGDLLEGLAATERMRLQTLIFARFPPPVTPDVWQNALADSGKVSDALREMASDKLDELQTDAPRWHRISLTALAILLAGIAGGWQARRLIRRHFGRDPLETSPSSSRRIMAALAEGIANALVPALLILVGVAFLHVQGILSTQAEKMVWTLASIIMPLFAVIGLTYAAFSPRAPAWRVVPVTPSGARALPLRIAILSVTLVVTANFQIVLRTYDLITGPLGSVFLLLQSLFVSGLLALMLPDGYWEEARPAAPAGGDTAKTGEDEEDRHSLVRLGRTILIVFIVVTPVIALCGYGRLSEFIQLRMIIAAMLIGIALLFRMAAQEGANVLLARRAARKRPATPANPTAAAGTAPMGVIPLFVTLAIDLVTIIIVVPLLLLLLGVPAGTLAIWGNSIAGGLTIGGVTISLTGIFLAVVTFIVGYALTGWIQRWLGSRILPTTTLDPSIRNSITSGITYIGVTLSALAAVSILGVGFANLAIVAGALSVGIGFGLKTVVENFVAGLLILIERPIRVGDWIIVGGNEGTVRHISVRATEIETFDRASVIVPNSEIIASSVTNWTHKNRIARLIIKVGVDYGTDTRLVASLLVDCAKSQEEILKYPEPKAFFVNFGDYSLDFELRCFVRDTDYMLSTKSNLHYAIDDIFRLHDINIPSPQHEVRIVAVPGGTVDDPVELKDKTAEPLPKA
ncbi:MAG: mechanosensitive ion channel [Parvibaculaceae bacterium]|nr:mechanosensitive ion channel [Parvibaculaceae bacterium]